MILTEEIIIHTSEMKTVLTCCFSLMANMAHTCDVCQDSIMLIFTLQKVLSPTIACNLTYTVGVMKREKKGELIKSIRPSGLWFELAERGEI